MKDFFPNQALKGYAVNLSLLQIRPSTIIHSTYGNKDDVKGLTLRLKKAIFVEPLILLQMAIQQL